MAGEELNTNANRPEIAILEKELRHISAIIKQKGREILNNYTITPPQFIALQWLDELGDMTIGDLSNKMYLAFSTTTDLIDRMEKNNLVQRIRDEEDRRVVRIHLLSEGKKIIKEVIEMRQMYLGDIVSDFEKDEIETLSVLLQKLYVRMSDEMNED
ncbi:putative HTH-type transcriptional regulator YsmB [Kurthia zopfii]|uniref:DNA-binding MarR family transcriptional regulator n=1 Tax=Kurthia zopfii TaxID=1650 RepID=A0A2U3AEQ8_9BACL|nr:MarR family transcriptional regulator [Kurthia zopfii]PWI23032.1 MarR family transcriptional regulator [Kurthia zopfii]TDR40492.1 DNA-binding MarR family transcriptional regulator [Kurthia zopfii]STX10231.1 Organic hydroperoxide resistance transcriptional regulator [Kurthia zopfii]VEI08142.1 Organic hydroperoxide resistance transcriptional regulator [Kurthia zopfii]GEK30051.1 putative HTH-type transcriptional regulator YsmB [Kurthia zopfii]